MYSLIKNLSHTVLVEHPWLLGNSIISKQWKAASIGEDLLAVSSFKADCRDTQWINFWVLSRAQQDRARLVKMRRQRLQRKVLPPLQNLDIFFLLTQALLISVPSWSIPTGLFYWSPVSHWTSWWLWQLPLQCYIRSDSSLVTPQGSAEVLQLPVTASEQEVWSQPHTRARVTV